MESLKDSESILSYLAKTDINAFISYNLKDSKGINVSQAKIHEEIQWHIDECIKQEIKYCGILAPWGHGKTEQAIISRTLKFLGENRNNRIFIVCNTDDNAKARVSSISRYILEDKDYHNTYPEIKPAKLGDWTKHKIIVDRDSMSKDGSVEAWGINSSGTGSRCDILIFDDPVDLRNAVLNPALRPQVKESFKNVWIPRLVANGFSIYIATIWHQDDLTSELLKSTEWKFLVMKIAEDYGSIECDSAFKGKFSIPLWSEEWSKDKLISRAGVIGTRAFNRGFRQKALSDEDRTFPSSESIFKEGVSINDVVSNNFPRICGIDPFGQWVVLFTIAINPQSHRRIAVEVLRGKWGPATTIQKISDVYRRLMPQIFVVENNAAQVAILEWAQEKNISIPVIPFTTGNQKADPTIGLPSLEVEFANGAWIIPLGGKHAVDCECGLCIFRKELADHPLAAAADTVMAAWFAREGARYLMKLSEQEAPQDDVVTAQDMGVEAVVIGSNY